LGHVKIFSRASEPEKRRFTWRLYGRVQIHIC
jgi:hypothetical protein